MWGEVVGWWKGGRDERMQVRDGWGEGGQEGRDGKVREEAKDGGQGSD